MCVWRRCFLLIAAVVGAADAKPVVVLVSGASSAAPFTTPTSASTFGPPAGHNLSALRAGLLLAGFDVYTAPVHLGPGPANHVPSLRFGTCPEVLPARVTIDSTADFNATVPALVGFLELLRERYGVQRAALVGWSMGGLMSREAIRSLRDSGSPLRVTSLVTLGTPWEGMHPNDIALGAAPLSLCKVEASCLAVTAAIALMPASYTWVSQLSTARMAEVNAQLAGLLNDIPVTAIAGDYYTSRDGAPNVWPNDGFVSRSSALALRVGDAIAPRIKRFTFNVVHGMDLANLLFFAKAIWEDPRVIAATVAAVKEGDSSSTSNDAAPALLQQQLEQASAPLISAGKGSASAAAPASTAAWVLAAAAAVRAVMVA